MYYELFPPDPELADVVECFWVVEDEDSAVAEQKIIPDGFPEVIFHYGDPYEIKLDHTWERQSRSLLGGQITKYFHLRNTGRSGMVGIKFKPYGVAHLLNQRMDVLTDRVVDLHVLMPGVFEETEKAVRTAAGHTERIGLLTRELMGHRKNTSIPDALAEAVRLIFETHGLMSVTELCGRTGMGERSLERSFNKCIGLSPKFYSRLIRFSYIFKLIQQEDLNLGALGFHSGYYDQPHFIRNFKAFTGEDPSKYLFDKMNMANFFLKR